MYKMKCLTGRDGTLIYSWSNNVVNLLSRLGLALLWNIRNVSLSSLNTVIQRIHDQHYQSWFSELEMFSKLCTYTLFKLDVILHIYHVCLILSIETRCRDLDALLINWQSKKEDRNIPKENRLCKLCNMQHVEDENHMFTVLLYMSFIH